MDWKIREGIRDSSDGDSADIVISSVLFLELKTPDKRACLLSLKVFLSDWNENLNVLLNRNEFPATKIEFDRLGESVSFPKK